MSYDFDNSGTTNLSAATPIAALPLTLACWFKVDTDGNGNTLVCLGNGSGSEIFRLAAAMDVASDPIRFRATNTGGSNHDFGGGTISLNTWYHAAIVVSGTGQAQRAVFLNGTKYTSAGANTRDITNATVISIGAMYQAGSYGADIDGKVAHVAVWDAALSDANITALAGGDNPLAVSATDLVAYWPLTADLVDVVASLTLTNSGGASLSGDNPTVDAPPSPDLAPNDMAVAVALEAASLTAGGDLVAADMAVAVALDSPTLQSLALLPDNADSDSYDTGTTSISGSTLNLEGYYDGNGFGGWVNTTCRLTNCAGQTISLVLDASGKQSSGPPAGNNNTTGSPWTPIWRDITGGTFGTWQKFTDYSRSTSTIYGTASFGSAADVRVAYKPVVSVAELDAFRQEIYTSPNAIEPPSSVAASSLPEGVHARLSHGTGPNTVSSGTVDLWCARVGTGPLVGMVVLCEHSQEDIGDLSAMQFVRWMLGASSEAAAFRSRFSVYVYVHNLSGRKCGRTRYNQDVGSDEDANRSWEDSNSEQTVVLKAAIELDIPVASVDLAFLLAYHGQQDANVNTAAFDIYTTTEFAADQEFHSRVATAVGSQVHQQDASTASLSSGTSRKFGHITRSAPLSLTLEHADAATGYPDPAAMFDTFAAATGTTLSALADEGYLGAIALTPADMAVAVALDAAAVDTSTSISPADMAVAVALDQPTLGSVSAVSPADVVVAVALDAATLSADGDLLPSDLAVAVSVESPTLAAATSVAPNDLAVAVSLDAAALTSGASLVAADLSVAVSIDSPVLSAESAVSPNDMAVVVSLDQAVLGQGGNRPPTRRRMNAGTWNRRIAA